MRHLIFVLFALFTAGAACAHDSAPTRAAEPIARTAEGAVYGEPMPAGLDAVRIDDAAIDPATHAGQARAFSGRITEVCQKMGCWLVLSGERAYARVRMHDHAYGVPKDARGEAVVYGELEPVEPAREADGSTAADAHASPRTELRIDARSVLIRAPD